MTAPYRFQERGVELIQRFNGRTLLADDRGLGKSFQSLSWAAKYLQSDDITIIICPSSLKYNWKRECSKHFSILAQVLEGSKPKKRVLRFGRVFIISYSVLTKWIPYLRDLDPKLIIVDEIHYIQSISSKRCKDTFALCEDVPHVIGLSGTPFTLKPIQMWSTLNLIRPDLYSSQAKYANRYCGPHKTPWGWKYDRASNMEELHDKLERELMIRRQIHQVLPQLPEKQRIIVPVEIKNRSEYNNALADLIGWIAEKGGLDRAKRAASAEFLVRKGYLLRLIAELKLPAVKEWVTDFLSDCDYKLIVFGVHKKVLAPLKEHFNSKCVLVDGSVTGIKRQEMFDKFNGSERIRLLLGNIIAAGVGWSAKAFCTAFCEFPWRPGDLLQAEDRTRGIGRGVEGKHSINYYLVAVDTIEEEMCKRLQKNQKMFEAILDGENMDGEKLDLFDQYIETLSLPKGAKS